MHKRVCLRGGVMCVDSEPLLFHVKSLFKRCGVGCGQQCCIVICSRCDVVVVLCVVVEGMWMEMEGGLMCVVWRRVPLCQRMPGDVYSSSDHPTPPICSHKTTTPVAVSDESLYIPPAHQPFLLLISQVIQPLYVDATPVYVLQ
jgi:hypothetical protein